MLFRICVACNHTNPPESRFCGNCGAPLQVRFCRLCRSPNDAFSRYCQSCGTELPELTTPEASPPIAPLVIATPRRPIADAPAVSLESTTIAAAFSGGTAQVGTGAPATDRIQTRPAGADAQPAIEVLPPQPARAIPIAADSAVTTLPVVIDEAGRAARRWRAPKAAMFLAIVAIVAAFGALALKAWRPGGANQNADRAEVPAAPQPAAELVPTPPAAADQANVAPPAPAPGAEPVAPPPTASSNKTAPRERRNVAPPGAGRTLATPVAPALPPALRECTPAAAALGLCTPEPKPEGD